MQFPSLFGIKDLAELTWKKYNQDLLDIRNWWNDHDLGNRSWTRGTFIQSPTVPNGVNATDAAAFGQIGGGFQAAVFASTASQTITTSSAFANTNLTASITPTSSSHRIKITISAAIQVSTATTLGHMTIKRGSTDLSSGTGFGMIRDGSVASQFGAASCSFSWIDSPATTSSTTYTMAIRNEDGTSTVVDCAGNITESIILEEIV